MEKKVISKTSLPIPFEKIMEIIEDMISRREHKKALLFALPAFLMLRFSDYSVLRWNDLKGERLIIYEQKTFKTRKTKKSRNVKICSQLKDIISRCKPKYVKDDDYIFLTRKTGKPFTITYANQEIKKICQKAGIEGDHHSTHSILKASCIRMFYQEGGNDESLMLVSKIRNHADLKTTLAYMNLDQARIDNAFDNLWK